MSDMKKTAKETGKEYWRSFAQLEDSPEYKQFLHREFPENASEMSSEVTRRKFLTLMGASLAFAGLAGCRRPVEKIIPYVIQPEEITPGVPSFYATSMPFGMNPIGLVVESNEGRPTKIEGNEKHPSSLGSSNSWIGASVLGLYDPDRATAVLKNGADSSWEEFVEYWKELLISSQYGENKGKGLSLLAESFSSPALSSLLDDFKRNYPNAKVAVYDSVSDENVYAGANAAFGKNIRPVYDFSKAKRVLALDSDFLNKDSEGIVNAKGFAKGRRVKDEHDEMNRLYVVESGFTVTGGMADHRKRLKSSEVAAFTASIAAALGEIGVSVKGAENSKVAARFDKAWIDAVVKDLNSSRGESLVVAGRNQSPAVHALVFAINDALGNIGNTVDFYEIKDSAVPSTDSLVQLAAEMDSGNVETVVVLGGNPVFDAPGDLDFANKFSKVKNKICFTTELNETAAKSDWHIPQSHFLESWGDTRSAVGTVSPVQPLISPLFDSKDTIEFLSLITNGNDGSGYEIVREIWKQKKLVNGDFEAGWKKALHDGVLESSGDRSVSARVNSNTMASVFTSVLSTSSVSNSSGYEITFNASNTLFDGRYANNGWLQELSDPVTKLTWDNAALISPSDAEVLGVKDEDVVTLSLNGKRVELPVLVQPGQADNSISIELGYGRTLSGRVGKGVGSDINPLRTSGNMNYASGLAVTKLEKIYELSRTQDHHSMEGRAIVREGTIDEYKENPKFAEEMVEHPPLKSLWNEHKYDEGYQWGMAIDLNVCTGCNACSVACQSENNIPVVGKEQVRLGREMSWIRIDRYYNGSAEEPQMVQMPVMCQHCEMAPCEQVCPVAATSHDEEGLNVMTYNRCIGTRYCSNNCPFKVRRFNFFNFTKDTPELVKMAQNPDVTMRFRGVMEKCTFCTQRINRARITSNNDGKTIRDGDFKVACEQTCPTDAIVFGNINDPESRVSKVKKQEQNYGLLSELNLKARNTFLAKLRNPNPEITQN